MVQPLGLVVDPLELALAPEVAPELVPVPVLAALVPTPALVDPTADVRPPVDPELVNTDVPVVVSEAGPPLIKPVSPTTSRQQPPSQRSARQQPASRNNPTTLGPYAGGRDSVSAGGVETPPTIRSYQTGSAARKRATRSAWRSAGGIPATCVSSGEHDSLATSSLAALAHASDTRERPVRVSRGAATPRWPSPKLGVTQLVPGNEKHRVGHERVGGMSCLPGGHHDAEALAGAAFDGVLESERLERPDVGGIGVGRALGRCALTAGQRRGEPGVRDLLARRTQAPGDELARRPMSLELAGEDAEGDHRGGLEVERQRRRGPR